MAGVVVPAYAETQPVKKVTLTWTSSAGGAADFTTKALNGVLLAVEFVPGSGGSQPTDDYDVHINDTQGLDVLRNLGVDLDNATSQFYVPAIMNGAAGAVGSLVPIEGPLTLAVTGAGNTKSGSIYLFIR